MLKIFKFASDMAFMTRWSQAQCLKEESVLEHTGFVVIYCVYLCKKYNLPLDDVLERAALHDMEEVITGDIPTPTKYSNERVTSALLEISEDAAQKVSELIFFGCAFETWVTAKDTETISGFCVRFADAAAIAYKIEQEYHLGNKTLLVYRDNIIKVLNKIGHYHCGLFEAEAKLIIKALEKLI